MSAAQLTFKIVGSAKDRGFVQFDDFVKFCETVNKCLRASEQVISGSSGEIEYRITDLKCQSATIKLQAVRRDKAPDRRQEVVDFFKKSVDGLEHGKIDPRLSPDNLETFRELSEPLKRHAAQVVIGRVNITERFEKTISKLLECDTSSEGCVTGILERINLHNERNEFVVYPPILNRHVPCVFPDAMLETIRAGLKRNVTVFGTLFYRAGHPLPSRVHAQTVEIHPDDSELPTLTALRDLGAWGTGGLSAVDFVRAIRDEQ